MKKSITTIWKNFSTTTKIFLVCFLFYFISKTFKN